MNMSEENKQVEGEAMEAVEAAAEVAAAEQASPSAEGAAEQAEEPKAEQAETAEPAKLAEPAAPARADEAAEAAEKPQAKKGGKGVTIAIVAAVVVLVVAAILGVSLFKSANQSTTEYDATLDTADTSAGVAAKVNDVEIGEKAITAYVENFRQAADLTDDKAWADYLDETGETAASFRESVVESYAYNELVRQAAESEGVTVSDSDIDAKVSEAKAAYSSDDDWKNYLSESGMTEAGYRDSEKTNLLYNALMDKTVGKVSASDADVLDYIITYTVDYKKATKLSDIPSDVVSKYREVCDYMAQSKKFSEWFTNYKKGVTVTINDMPSGLSYDVKTSSASSSTTSSASK
jgi:hypothetical protein